MLDKRDTVGDEDASFVGEDSVGTYDVVEYVTCDVAVDGGEAVVEEGEVGSGVDGACEGDAGALASGEGDTFFADFG